MADFINQIREAQVEAVKRQIKANAILINRDIATSSIYGTEMILGMHKIVTNELPKEFDFAICECNNLPMSEKEKAEKYDELLIDYMQLQAKFNKLKEVLGE